MQDLRGLGCKQQKQTLANSSEDSALGGVGMVHGIGGEAERLGPQVWAAASGV